MTPAKRLGILGPAGAAALALVVVLSAGPARADLRGELAAVAKDVKVLLDERGESALAVGQFTGPPTLPTSAGPGIAKMLGEELKKIGVTVKVRANVGLEGRYRDVKVKETGQVAVELTMNLLDRGGKSILKDERRVGVFDDADIAALLGLTAALPPRVPVKERSRRLEVAIDNPTAHLDGTKVAAAPGSPYALEVLVSNRVDGMYLPRKPVLEDGLAFVPIRRGEYYRIRLINKSGYDAAVRLSIDGLSLFAFSTVKTAKGKPYTQLILDAGKSYTVRGWHVTNQESDSFRVTAYAKSAAAELKSTAKTGTITATFAAAWPKGGKPPADEPDKAQPRSVSGDATGRGPRVAAKYREVQRNFGVIRATVSVRYTK